MQYIYSLFCLTEANFVNPRQAEEIIMFCSLDPQVMAKKSVEQIYRV